LVANKLGYSGVGVGIALFAVFGFHPGVYMGGVLGINMANLLFGMEIVPTPLHRIFAGAGMFMGVVINALLFAASGFYAGWFTGLVYDASVKRLKESGHNALRTENQERREASED
jgi:hypothetical protein